MDDGKSRGKSAGEKICSAYFFNLCVLISHVVWWTSLLQCNVACPPSYYRQTLYHGFYVFKHLGNATE